LKSFAIVIIVTAALGICSALTGFVVTQGSDLSGWRSMQQSLDVIHLPEFVIVAYLHAGGYLGALIGLVLAIAFIKRRITPIRAADAIDN
jgi:hypothetical protein